MKPVNTSRTRPHTRIDNVIIDYYIPLIKPQGFAVYAALTRHFNHRTGLCNPSYNTLARETGMNRKTVIEYVKRLKDYGLIKIEAVWDGKGDRSSNHYRIINPSTLALSLQAGQKEGGGLWEPGGGGELPPHLQNGKK